MKRLGKLGLQGKILLVFTSVTLLGGLALFLTAGWQLQQATLQFYQHDVQTLALNMANGLSELLEEAHDHGENTTAMLQHVIERGQSDLAITYTVLDLQRRVLASTYTPRPPLYAQLPLTEELRQALEGHVAHTVRDDENGQARTYAAVPILYEGEQMGVLRASAPMAPAYEEAREKWLHLAAVALPIVLLSAATSLWLGRALTRPIRQLHASALRIASGALEERVSIRSQDEIGQLADAFNFMVERVNALIEAQRSFVSYAAHELRNPLMRLKLRVEALQRGGLEGAQRTAYLDDLAHEIEHMSTLINQLLVLARLDEGRHQADRPPADVVAFLHDVARTWRIRAQGVGLNFHAEIPPTLPETPVAMSDLQIVLDNLLENALKYTPPGGEVTLRAWAAEDGLHLVVEDNGEGFTPEESTVIFERFARLTRARERDVPGTGLGLAIVRAVLEQYDGAITAHSDGPDRGARFEAVWPPNGKRAQAAGRALPPEAARAAARGRA